MQHCVWKQEYTWNLSICACEYDQHSDIDEYFKSLVDDLVIKCNEIVDY